MRKVGASPGATHSILPYLATFFDLQTPEPRQQTCTLLPSCISYILISQSTYFLHFNITKYLFLTF